MKKSLQILTLLLCSSAVWAESITWLSFNRPPWFMENGQGYGDRMQVRYEALLPEFQHESVVVNLARMNAEMEKGRNFCISGLADLPAFRRYMHLSRMTYVLPQPKIFMRQETYSRMGRPKVLSIEKLSNNSTYHMGLIRGATYLPLRVEDYEESQHATIISSSSPIISIVQMMDLGRIDWAADYPHIVQWGAMSGAINIDNEIAMVDIEEFEGNTYIQSGIACTKNAWGKEIIDQLNKLVQKDTILDIRHWIAQWMPPGVVKEEFIRFNKARFGY